MVDQPSNTDIFAAFKKRRSRQLVLIVPLFAVFITAGYFSSTGIKALNIGPLTLLCALGAIAAGVVAFSMYNWRCPACKKYLGKGLNPVYCPKCGKQLRPQ
jgi:hypothetical protein